MRLALFFAILLAVSAPLNAQDLKFFTIGSGEPNGGYYVAATAICDAVNRAELGRMRCSPEPTPGSLYNLAALRDQQIDLAFTQSDWQRDAVQGADIFTKAGPWSSLRSVMSLYPETVTILAGADSGIVTVDDLRGKRVDLGPPASGRNATGSRVLAALGVPPSEFGAVAELTADAAIDELCAGYIDATLLIVGHPNAGVARALSECGARIVPLAGNAAEQALDIGYTATRIPAELYPGALDRDVPSYAVMATIVTGTTVDPEVIEAVVATTIDRLPALTLRAPMLAGLTPADMRSRGLSAPLHPGAEAAFAAEPPE